LYRATLLLLLQCLLLLLLQCLLLHPTHTHTNSLRSPPILATHHSVFFTMPVCRTSLGLLLFHSIFWLLLWSRMLPL
jgi:hypothetical protein